MNVKKDEYQRATANAEKAKIIADLIHQWGQEHQGRFIRFYNGIPYELSKRMLKEVIQKLLRRSPGESTSEISPATARRPTTVSHPIAPDSGAYPVPDFPSSKSPLPEYHELPSETDEDDNDDGPFVKKASPSPPRVHCLTLEVLFDEVKSTPFLTVHEKLVERVLTSRVERAGKRKAAPAVDDDSKPKARKLQAPQVVESPAAESIPAPLTVHPMSPDQFSVTWSPFHAIAYGNVMSPPRPPTFFTSALAAAATITPPNDSQKEANEDELDRSHRLFLFPDDDDDDDEEKS
jgi:hypothetical protein